MRVQAYDVGGTWMRAAIIEGGVIKKRKRENTKINFTAQIKRISKKLGEADCISLALPGPVKDGILVCAPPLKISYPRNIREELSSLEKEIIIENDVTTAAYAELHLGYGKQWENFYLLTLSTGIGVGIVRNGTPVDGKEFGHYRISPLKYNPQTCDCGKRNCWSAYSSGRGIDRLVKALNPTFATESLWGSYQEKTWAKITLEIIRNCNAQGLGIMINAQSMEGIVIMGSLGIRQFKKIIPTEKEIKKYTSNEVPPIVPTELGEDIGLLGAYYRAAKQ